MTCWRISAAHSRSARRASFETRRPLAFLVQGRPIRGGGLLQVPDAVLEPRHVLALFLQLHLREVALGLGRFGTGLPGPAFEEQGGQGAGGDHRENGYEDDGERCHLEALYRSFGRTRPLAKSGTARRPGMTARLSASASAPFRAQAGSFCSGSIDTSIRLPLRSWRHRPATRPDTSSTGVSQP